MGTRPVPGALSSGRARQCSGTGLCVDCRRVLWVQGPGVNIQEKIVLLRNLGYKTRGIAMRLNVAYSEVKVQVRKLVRVVGIIDSLPHVGEGSVFGENSIYRAPGCKWAQETFAGCPQQRHVTGEPGKVQGRDRVGIEEWSCGYRSRVVSIRLFGEHSIYRVTRGTRLGGGV